MNKPIRSFETSLSRRQVMIGAAGMTLHAAPACEATAAASAATRRPNRRVEPSMCGGSPFGGARVSALTGPGCNIFPHGLLDGQRAAAARARAACL